MRARDLTTHVPKATAGWDLGARSYQGLLLHEDKAVGHPCWYIMLVTNVRTNAQTEQALDSGYQESSRNKESSLQ